MTTNRDYSHLNSVPLGEPVNWGNRMHARSREILIGLVLMTACVGGCSVDKDFGSTKFGVFAGFDTNVVTGDTVQLSGIAHHRTKEIRVEWTQLSGPPVSIVDATQVSARFEAPIVSTTTTLEFR